jgi:CheY-like chemotaxis protein
VLLIEDDTDSRELYAEFLRLDGWRVDEAATGRRGLDKGIALQPDVITTDLSLGDMDGLDVCREFRRNPATSAIPIVVVTAHAFPTEVTGALAAGCSSILIKPCLPQRLVAELRRVMAEARQLQIQTKQATNRAASLKHQAKAILRTAHTTRARSVTLRQIAGAHRARQALERNGVTESPERGSADAAAATVAKPLLLIVEYDTELRESLSSLLRSAGFQATGALCGSEALQRVAERRPMAVITAVSLPDFDGWELTRKLKADASNVPILVVDDHLDPGARQRADALGCAGYFQKPFNPGALLQQLRYIASNV